MPPNPPIICGGSGARPVRGLRRAGETGRDVYELTVKGEFAAAHRIREYDGSCERLHGHNWAVAVRVAAGDVDRLGMVIDFRDLKRHLAAVLDELDHTFLNDLPRFQDVNPTTEHIARTICEGLAERLPEGAAVTSVTAWESPKCGVTYTPDAEGEAGT